MNLENPNISYVILSNDNVDSIQTYLYSKEYQVLPLQTYYKEQFDDSTLGWGDVDNNTLRKDVVFLLNYFQVESAIIKYKGETSPKKIFRDGSEKLLEVYMYNTDSEKISYLYMGLSFSFVEAKKYWMPKKKEDFRQGMIIEYFNNSQWNEKIVFDLDTEWDKMYKLLVKYDKIRVLSKV